MARSPNMTGKDFKTPTDLMKLAVESAIKTEGKIQNGKRKGQPYSSLVMYSARARGIYSKWLKEARRATATAGKVSSKAFDNMLLPASSGTFYNETKRQAQKGGRGVANAVTALAKGTKASSSSKTKATRKKAAAPKKAAAKSAAKVVGAASTTKATRKPSTKKKRAPSKSSSFGKLTAKEAILSLRDIGRLTPAAADKCIAAVTETRRSRKAGKKQAKAEKQVGAETRRRKASAIKTMAENMDKFSFGESHLQKVIDGKTVTVNGYTAIGHFPNSQAAAKMAMKWRTGKKKRTSNPGRPKRKSRRRKNPGGLSMEAAIAQGKIGSIAAHVGVGGVGYAAIGAINMGLEKLGHNATTAPRGVISKISKSLFGGNENKGRAVASGLGFLGLGLVTGAVKIGSKKTSALAFLEKPLGVYGSSFLIGAGVHMVRDILNAVVGKSTEVRAVFGLPQLAGFGGYEIWYPEMSGYENWTPAMSGYENWTPAMSGYENWTPELSGYEQWTPSMSGWEPGYQAPQIGNPMGDSSIGYEAMGDSSIGYEAMNGNPFGEPF